MKLKNHFLSLSALLAMGMATTSAWGAENVVDPTVVNSNGSYSVYMPTPASGSDETVTKASWSIPEGVNTIKVYDDGGPDGAFSNTGCGKIKCAEYLALTTPEGFFIHLSGSLTSNPDENGQNNGQGARAYFAAYKNNSASDANRLIYVKGTDLFSAWSYQEMLFEFYTNTWNNANNKAGLDATVELALNVGQNGIGSYVFSNDEDHLELHASATTSQVNKATTLTAPAGSMLYLTFNSELGDGDTIFVLNGESSSTDTLLRKTNAVNSNAVYSSSNNMTIVVKTDESGLNNILKANVYVVKKNTSLSTTGIDIYNNEAANYAVAKIGDPQSGTVSIPNAISVNVIEFNRTFTTGKAGTIVLPFSLPAGATTNAKFYKLKEVVSVDCKWKATFRNITLDNANALPAANTPYAVIVPEATELQFNLNGGQASFQTGNIAEQYDITNKWIFKGTYGYKTWSSTDPEFGLAYALAAADDPYGKYKAGQYGKVGEDTYAVPMRAYMRKVDANVTLGRPLAKGEVSSIESLPESIDVEFIDEEEKTTAIGRMNTVTGAIKIDRWFDLKGRSTNHKPTTKGAFFNKKGIAK